MQALGLVRIFKKQNFVEISFTKIQSVRKGGWAERWMPLGSVTNFLEGRNFFFYSPIFRRGGNFFLYSPIFRRGGKLFFLLTNFSEWRNFIFLPTNFSEERKQPRQRESSSHPRPTEAVFGFSVSRFISWQNISSLEKDKKSVSSEKYQNRGW